MGEPVADDSGSSDAQEVTEEEPEEATDEATDEATEETVPSVRPPSPFSRASLSRFLMIFLFLLALYAIIDQQVGLGFARAADAVLFPVFGFGGTLPVLTILLAGILTTTIGSIIRDHYTNWVKMARTQKVMSAWRKENMEAMRKGQQTRLAQLKEVQKGFAKDQMDMMSTPYKSTAWTVIPFTVIFTWLQVFVGLRFEAPRDQLIPVALSNHVL